MQGRASTQMSSRVRTLQLKETPTLRLLVRLCGRRSGGSADLDRAVGLPGFALPCHRGVDDVFARLRRRRKGDVKRRPHSRVLARHIEGLSFAPLDFPTCRSIDLHVGPRVPRRCTSDIDEYLELRWPNDVYQ